MMKFCWGQQGPGGENFSGKILKPNWVLQKFGVLGLREKCTPSA
jgi:hypothetical protein